MTSSKKAFGAFYGPYVTARRDEVVWTRGQPKHFQSSNLVKRGFCGDCGTQLTFDGGWPALDIAIGAFDDNDGTLDVLAAGKRLTFKTRAAEPLNRLLSGAPAGGRSPGRVRGSRPLRR